MTPPFGFRTKPMNTRILPVIASLFVPTFALAGSATWDLNPGSADWNTAMNWTPATVPNGSADTATFDASNTTAVSISANTQVDGIVFTSGATNSYEIQVGSGVTLKVTGTGITNNSGATQVIQPVEADSGVGTIVFSNSATAGTNTVIRPAFLNTGPTVNGPQIIFNDTSTADNAHVASDQNSTTTFNNNSTAATAFITVENGSLTTFNDNSTAANATIEDDLSDLTFNNSSTAANANIFLFFGVIGFSGAASAGNASIENHAEGIVTFSNASTAGNATISNQGRDAQTFFYDSATAGNATIINASAPSLLNASTTFENTSTGGAARIEVFNSAYLDISGHALPGVTVGSIEGDGFVDLGANNLTVGSNNLSTTFSGVAQDGDNGGVGGSLTKIGTGTLLLSGTNTYTGSTTVNSGELVVDGSITSDVTINGGTLSGSGTVGAVTVSGGGTLAPGDGPGILTVQGNLKLMMGANYLVTLNGAIVGTQYSQANVFGTVTLNGSTLLVHLGFTPTIGTTFIIINNQSSAPVTGTFDGLSEGSTFTVNGQSFRISYDAGDGNDVVLTAVVPEPTTFVLLIAAATGIVIKRSLHR